MKGILRKLLISHFVVFAVPLIGFAIFGLLNIEGAIKAPFEKIWQERLASIGEGFGERLSGETAASIMSNYRDTFKIPASADLMWFEAADIAKVHPVLSARGRRKYVSDNGSPKLAMAIRFSGTDSSGDAVLLLKVDASSLFTEISTLRRNIILTLLVALGFSAYIAFVFARSFSKPVQLLTSYAEQVAAGKDADAPKLKTGDEIEVLSDAFGRMTAKLQERMEYIRDFARMLSHELKTPLTSIIGAAEILNDGAKDDKEAREKFLTNIATDSEHLKNIVEDTLVLARLESDSIPFEFSTDDFNEFVHNMVETHLHRAAEKGITLTFKGNDTGCVKFDSWRMEQAIGNLISNAIRFTPEKGTVTVSTAKSSGEVLVKVIDTGTGIEPENLPHVFERFFTRPAPDEEEYKGTGLGLAIAKGIVDGHNGTITAESVSGEGSTFTIKLPTDQEPLKTVSAA